MKMDIFIYFIFGFIMYHLLFELFGLNLLLKVIISEKLYNLIIDERSILKPDKISTPLTLSKEFLGRNTWSLIHSIAAAYPISPTIEEEQALKNFVLSL